jgi:pimeloyl-ACP methyl ester carboxylesterase
MSPLSFLPTRSRQPQFPLFVFFPGMDGTGKLLEKQSDRLAARFDVRCLAIPSNDRANWAELSQQAVQLIAAELAQGQALYLCGESFGACLAMQVAARMGTAVDQLVLINPASSFARFPLLAAGSALSGLLPDMMYPFSARILATFLINPDRVTAADRQSLLDAMLSVQPQSATWRLNLLKQFQVDAIVAKIVDIPVRLIAGELDRLLPSALEVRTLQKLLPKSTATLLPRSGHACLLEQDMNLADLL